MCGAYAYPLPTRAPQIAITHARGQQPLGVAPDERSRASTPCGVHVKRVHSETRVKVLLKRNELRALPASILKALQFWISEVESRGLAEVRKVAGYHDEPLKGQLQGRRSVRLNRGYRAIYVEITGGIEIEVVHVGKNYYKH